MNKEKTNLPSSDSYANVYSFVDRHIGPSRSDIVDMLKYLDCDNLDELILSTVPNQILLDVPLKIDAPLNEQEALAYLKERMEENKIFKSYIGMGYHDTITPTVILRNILENPGWYTAYTPYQPEVSQGRLEMLINYQQMIMDLTGLEVANASLLDEGTAAVEAMLLAFRYSKDSRNVFLVSDGCHPQTVSLLTARAKPLGIEIKIGNLTNLIEDSSTPFFGFIAQYPDTIGNIKDYEFLIKKGKSRQSISILACDLLALSILKSPGEMSADIAIGSSQRFGVPMGFGGPHAAFISCKEEYKRLLPGRIIGRSVDKNNNLAYRMALQTREQHIRREKATSNICTAQSLLAITAAAYAIYHGPRGIKGIADTVHQLTRILSKGFSLLGFETLNKVYFDTVAVKSPKNRLSAIKSRALKNKLNFRFYSADIITISLDETTKISDLNNILKCFSSSSDIDLLEVEDSLLSDFDAIPNNLKRTKDFLTHPVFNSYISETDFLRYIKRLEDKDIALNKSMIPLGSCTMKLNATTEMIPISWSKINSIHPFAPKSQTKGYRFLINKLETVLCDIAGFDQVSLQPNAGAQGELAGLMTIRAFQEVTNEQKRDICLIPSSAHGTNPASAILAGFKVEIVKCDDKGNVDTKDLAYKIQQYTDRISTFMITYPSTHGVFEENIGKICRMIHDAGGQVYMDGANLNAIVGISKPGHFGPDVCHINLHKTFSIPHGGGGPGVGPIAVKEHLSAFLPNHSVVKNAGPESSFGPISSAPWGSASILAISLMYIMMMGPGGIKKATQVAILNANYVAKKLRPYFPILYTGRNERVAHECIIDLRDIRKHHGITEEDIAKRLIDYGFHAPTMSFPVPGTLMIEPTESESRKEIDRFCDALVSIHNEILTYSNIQEPKSSPLKNAPHTFFDVMNKNFNYPLNIAFPMQNDDATAIRYISPVARVNNAYGDKNFACSCLPVDQYKTG
ncbi:MAG: glycine dehydrogenase (aminomethyl-transferring) [Spirochaetales bacterium]|nr:glycine dehydrogenase (aminomethyl-transferring) [Spirochaetales bacterium]